MVLFANGEAAAVTSPGGWGVVVHPSTHRTDQVDAASDRGNVIVIEYWEKAADVFSWTDGRFESETIAD